MFWFTLYLVTTYGAAGLLHVVVRRAWEQPRRTQGRLLRGIWMLPLLPYALIAAQTLCFGSALRPHLRQAMRDTGMLEGEPLIVRVMAVAPARATVYVTERCGSSPGSGQVAELITLRRSGSRWLLAHWDGTVWSDCGSAEGNTFPPFPEAREF
jgi:hypothetical protein